LGPEQIDRVFRRRLKRIPLPLRPGEPDRVQLIFDRVVSKKTLWELSGGREIRRFESHSDAVTSVAFSPDGRWVLTRSDSKCWPPHWRRFLNLLYSRERLAFSTAHPQRRR
jgi:WD40 repeat protein